MPEEIPSPESLLRSLIGRPCVAAEIGLDCALRLVFLPEPGLPKERAPMVQSLASAWRILRGQDLLTGQADCVDWERGLEPFFAVLFGQSLVRVSIETTGPRDLRLEFEREGLVVEFLEISHSEPAWEIDLSDGRAYEIGPNGRVLSEPTKLSHRERAIAQHSEKFAARIGIVPASDTPEHRCGACAYWRSVTGGFYFWDYGVCTNLDSPSGAQATHKAGGCSFFETEQTKI